jgi:hypothetical protein
MKKKLFQEYLTAKGKVAKPVKDCCADQIVPKTPPNTPPQGGAPYSKGNEPKPKTLGKGLGDEGSNNLKWNPNIWADWKGKTIKSPIVNQIEVATIIANGVVSDPQLLETIVRQFKERGLLGALVAEVFQHREAAIHLAEIMTNEYYGPRLCKTISRAINEEVAPPFSDQLNGEEQEEEDDTGPLSDSDEEEDESKEDDNEDEKTIEDAQKSQDATTGGEEPQVGVEEDPTMAAGMQGIDPNIMGGAIPDMTPPIDPNMMGGAAPMPPMDPNIGIMPVQQFQRAIIRAYQRAMMRKR